VGVDVTVGMTATGLGATMPTVGDKVGIGTAAAELTPRLPISVDPNGIPIRAAPPDVVGDVDVGVEDDATPLEPEPHIPDIPEVSSVPEGADIPDDIEVPADDGPPTAIPPPSKLVVDPNMVDGADPKVEQTVPLLGIEIVPVTPIGAGLMPGDVISVEPSGMPVGEAVEFVVMPSGEVAPIVGVGVAIPPTCAMATLLAKSAGRSIAINQNRIGTFRSAAAQR
jgi:hypothetical protein